MIIHCYLHLPFYLKGYLLSLKSVSKSLRCLAYKRFTSPVCPASGEALSGSLLPALSSPHPPSATGEAEKRLVLFPVLLLQDHLQKYLSSHALFPIVHAVHLPKHHAPQLLLLHHEAFSSSAEAPFCSASSICL